MFFHSYLFLFWRSDHDAQLSEELFMFLKEFFALPLNILATLYNYILTKIRVYI
jgi:hypothetical protein